MEETRTSSKFEPEDFISSMPDIVVSNILDRLPLQEAVRTCILASAWRFKWTILSQLVFDEYFYQYLQNTKALKNYGRIISWLLLHLEGVITKFVIYIGAECLLVHRIKDLTLRLPCTPLKLPNHLFSCMELIHLELSNCCFDPPTSFRGFPNLLSLELPHVKLESQKFGQFFTECPVLEILKMGWTKVKPVEIAKLTNLKVLSLSCYNLDITVKPDENCSNSILQLIGFLPKLHELQFTCRKFKEHTTIKRFPTTFPCVKTLKLCLDNAMNPSCAYELIGSFPNLQSLQITTYHMNTLTQPKSSLPEEVEVNYSTMGLLQLRNAVFTHFMGSEDEV